MLLSGLWRVWVIVLCYSLGYVAVWDTLQSGKNLVWVMCYLGYVTVWVMLQSGLRPVWVMLQYGLCHSLGCGSLGYRQSVLVPFWDKGSLG